MPKWTVEIERHITQRRIAEVEASSERAARRLALKGSRYVDEGGEVKIGQVGDWCGGYPSRRVRIAAVSQGWSGQCRPAEDVGL